MVHINNGAEEIEPIILRLLPGEETIFELRLINHGDPSNISVDASPPIIKAMRLKRSNHYVVMEEIIPVLARMPDDLDRVDGELLFTSEKGTLRVPISLVSESNGSPDKGDDWEGGEEEEPLPAMDEGCQDGPEGEEPDSSSTIDLQSYHRARESMDASNLRPEQNSSAEGDNHDSKMEGKRKFWDTLGPRTASSRQDPYASWAREDFPYPPGSRQEEADREYSYDSASSEAEEDESRDGFHLKLAEWGAVQIIPLLLLLMIIAMLVLTFYTSTIPEFIGALASSILIVTLIIYGAATLLKA